MTTNVEYYEKMNNLKTVQHENEQKRLELEKQMNAQLQSDKRVARLRALRLQNYWKKLCEDEKRSRERNDQLLREFDRVESHLSKMEAQTDKLKHMKKQYEDYIESTYPNWKEKVQQYQREKQAQQLTEVIPPQYQYQPVQVQYMPPTPQDSSRQTYTSQQDPYGIPQGANQVHHSSIPAQASMNQQYSSMPQPSNQQQQYSTVQHQPSQQQQYFTVQQPSHQEQYTSVQQPSNQQQQYVSGQQQPSQQQPYFTEQQPQQHQQHHSHSDYNLSKVPSGNQNQQFRKEQENEPHQMYKEELQKRDQDNTLADDVSDFGSEDSLPLTPQDLEPAPLQQKSSSQTNVKPEQAEEKKPSVPSADVTLSGLYNMLRAVEDDMPNKDSAMFIYKSDEPAPSVRKEIIQNANSGRGLQHVNGETVSMVVLEQLPLLLANTGAGCLLPDSMLFRVPASLTKDSIKRYIESESHELFDNLFEHFVQLLKYKILSVAELAKTFAPILIDIQSPYEDKAREAITMLLDSVDPGDLVPTPVSTSTFSTIPGQNTLQQATKEEAQDDNNDDNDDNDDEFEANEEDYDEDEDTEPSEKTPTLPDNYGSDSDHKEKEASQNQNKFLASSPPMPSVDLTQSAAYRALLGDTVASSMHAVLTDDDSDDIENQIGGGSLSTGKASVPMVASPRNVHKNAIESEDDTPSFDDKPGGYVPTSSAVTPRSTVKSEVPKTTGPFSTLGSSLGSTGKSSKKPGFYGDSDTDEEVEVPGAGTTRNSSVHGQDADDFDFYG